MVDESARSALQPRAIGKLPAQAVIAPTEQILRTCLDTLVGLTSRRAPRRSLLNFSALYIDQAVVIAGPCVGGPAAVLVAETLAASGVCEFYLLGAAGALASPSGSIAVGDLVLPIGAFPDDGTSRLYGANGPIALEHNNAQAAVNNVFAAADVHAHRGVVASTDAPYLETTEKLRDLASKGVLAIEMEYTALLQFVCCRGLALGAAFVVSDLRPSGAVGFARKEFRTGLARAADLTLRAALGVFEPDKKEYR